MRFGTCVLQRIDGEAPLLAGGHALYDSIAIHHAARWDLPLPSRAETLAYMQRVHDRLLERLDPGTTPTSACAVKGASF